MYCTKCGKEHQDNMSFCPYCGQPIGENDPSSTPTPTIANYQIPPNYTEGALASNPNKKSYTGLIITIISIAVAISIVAVVVIMFLHGRKGAPLQEYLNSSEFTELMTLNSKMITSFNSVVGANYESDEKVLDEIVDNTLVYSRDLYEKSLNMSSKITDEELLAAHRICINYANSFQQTLSFIISAIQKQDFSQMSEANRLLNDANNYALDYATELRKIGEKYNIDVNAIISTNFSRQFDQIGNNSIDKDNDDSKSDHSKALQFVLMDNLGDAMEGDTVIVKEEDVLLDGNAVQSAIAKTQETQGNSTPENIVSVIFTPDGANTFAEITASHIGERLAIVSDGVLISAPVIHDKISGGECVISGGFNTLSDAAELANKLNQ